MAAFEGRPQARNGSALKVHRPRSRACPRNSAANRVRKPLLGPLASPVATTCDSVCAATKLREWLTRSLLPAASPNPAGEPIRLGNQLQLMKKSG